MNIEKHMNTLVIAPFSPYPVVFGGAVRLYHLLKMFSAFSNVTLLAYRSWSKDGDNVGDLRHFCERVILVDQPRIRGHQKLLLQAKSLFGQKTFQYLSHYSQRFQDELNMLLEQEHFDSVVTECSQMGYFQYHGHDGLRILDLHNIEFELLQRRARVEANPLKRLALKVEARKFSRDELSIYQQHDLVLVPSKREAHELRGLLPTVQVESLPNSIDADYFAFQHSLATQNEIVFVGTMHVDANRDGVVYFMEEIFPLIERAVPDIHFTIVGGGPPPEILAYGRRHNVEVTGFVDDVRPYMARAKALVVPLRVGGGTRLKILEALAFGLPSISTSVGCEGIDVEDDEHISIADTPADFASNVVRMLADADLRRRLRQSGKMLVEREYTWGAVGKRLGVYIQAIKQSSQTK